MSKRALKKYVEELSKKELEEQIIELYDRLKPVKEFYDFVFNPKEDLLFEEAKFKIAREYFPPGIRRPKKRRSVAQNYVKHFKTLGADPSRIADLMLYALEIATAFNAETPQKSAAFYKSLLKTFIQFNSYVNENGIDRQYTARVVQLLQHIEAQDWFNKFQFIDNYEN
jgi:hypothetical protein